MRVDNWGMHPIWEILLSGMHKLGFFSGIIDIIFKMLTLDASRKELFLFRDAFFLFLCIPDGTFVSMGCIVAKNIKNQVETIKEGKHKKEEPQFTAVLPDFIYQLKENV